MFRFCNAFDKTSNPMYIPQSFPSTGIIPSEQGVAPYQECVETSLHYATLYFEECGFQSHFEELRSGLVQHSVAWYEAVASLHRIHGCYCWQKIAATVSWYTFHAWLCSVGKMYATIFACKRCEKIADIMFHLFSHLYGDHWLEKEGRVQENCCKRSWPKFCVHFLVARGCASTKIGLFLIGSVKMFTMLVLF